MPSQEHVYHVLEVSSNRFPIRDEINSPISDPDAPELPPPLQPDSQDTSDTPPVYKDINELSCKPNKVVDFEQCCHQEAYGLNDNTGTENIHQQKVHTHIKSLCHMCMHVHYLCT